MKKEKNIFSIFVLLAFANSIAYLFFTEESIRLLGGEVSGISLIMAKHYGAIALGSALVIWMLRETEDHQTKKVMILGIFVSMLASAVIGIYGSWSNWFDNFDWLFILIDSTLTIWAIYIFLTKYSRK